MNRPLVIALAGRAGCGKSTAAAYLAEAYGFERIRFAGPLKAMLRAFLDASGLDPVEVERMIEGDLKEAAALALAGNTPRYAMQTLGTDWGRVMLAQDLWVRAWSGAAAAALARGVPGIVVEDCRFENEAEAVQALGGTVLRIERPGLAPIAGDHASERGFDLGLSVVNDGCILGLRKRLDGVLHGLWSGDRAFFEPRRRPHLSLVNS